MVGVLMKSEKVIPMRGKEVTGGWDRSGDYNSCHDEFTAVDSSELLNGRLGSMGKTFLYTCGIVMPRMLKRGECTSDSESVSTGPE
jgi:hypothetical protein